MAIEIGVIKAISGTVTVVSTDGSTRTLEVGDKLYLGEVVATSSTGAIEIEFVDGGLVDLGRDSQVRLDFGIADLADAIAVDEDDADEANLGLDEVALQNSLLAGADPTFAGEDTASGGSEASSPQSEATAPIEGSGVVAPVVVERVTPTPELAVIDEREELVDESSDGFLQSDDLFVERSEKDEELSATNPLTTSPDSEATVDDTVTVADTGSTDEGTTLTVNAADGVLANDTAPDDSLTVASFSVAGDDTSYTAGDTATMLSNAGVTVGTLRLNSDGGYVFTPAANYNGAVPVVTYQTNTGASSTLTLTVDTVDDATQTVVDTNSTNEDTTLTVAAGSGGVLDNDSDADDTLTVASFSVAGDDTSYTAGDTATMLSNAGVTVGTLRLNSDGGYVFTPAANYNGAVPVVTYQTNTGASSTLTLTVDTVDDATQTVVDTNSTNEDTTLTVAAGSGGVLDNDSDADDTLTVASFSVAGDDTSYTAGDTATMLSNAGVTVGTLRLNSDGGYVFTPAANYNGAVPVVTYQTNTGASSTLTLTVDTVDDATQTVVDTNSTNEDTTLTVAAGSGGVLDNDSDADDTLTVASFSVAGDDTSYTAGDTATMLSNAGVTVGTLRLNSDGGYVFTPAANYNGAVPVVTYQTNTGASSTLTLTVDTVDDATQTVVDTNSTNEDTTLTVAAGSGGVLDNDSDADDTLTVASFSVAGDDTSYTAGDTATMLSNAGVTVGTLRLNSDGGYVFTPAANYNGAVPVVTYQTNTGASSTLTLTVDTVDDATQTVVDTNSTNEDTTLTVAAGSGGVLDNDSDADDTLTVASFSVAGDDTSYTAGDTATMLSNAGVTVGTLRLNSDGGYVFTPAANYNGAVPVVTYQTNTGASSTLTLTVDTVDDATQTVVDTNSTNEDTTLTVAAGSGGVLDNDSDADDTLTVASFSVAGDDTSYTAGDTATMLSNAGVTVGTLRLNSDGGYVFTPAANYNGAVPVVTYQTNTGASSTLTLTVDTVDDATQTVVDTNSTNEDTTLTVAAGSGGVLDNDSDADDTLTVASFSVAGDDTSYTAGDTATMLSNAGVTVGTLRLNSDGGYVFTPAANYNGAVPVVTYQTNTGASSTLTLTVDTVDDATQTVVDTNSTNEDTTLTVAAGSGGVLDNDSDADDTLTVASFSVAGDDTSYTAGDTATMLSNAGVTVGTLRLNSDGGYVFTPAANYNGAVPVVTYQTNTGASSTLTLTVDTVDDATQTVVDTNSTNEDTTLTVAAGSGGVLDNDSDADDTLTVASFSVAGDDTSYTAGDTATMLSNAGVTVGTLRLNSDGGYVFTPAANYNGAVPVVTYQTNTGASSTLTLTVDTVDDATQTVVDTNSTNEDTTLTVAAGSGGVLDNDSDADDTLTVASFSVAGDDTSYTAGDTATMLSNAGVTVGTLRLNSDGGYVFTPAANYNGAVPVVTYQTNTGASSTLTLTVDTVDDATQTVVDTNSTNEDTTLTVAAGSGGVLDNDSDADDTLTVASFSVAGDDTSYTAGDTATMLSNAGVTVGTLRLNSDGGYVFTPAANYNGAVPVVTYQTNTGASSTLTLTVDTVDDATQTVVDTNSTNEDTTLTVAAGSGGVLDNDSDADDTLTVASFSVAGDDTSYTAGDTATMLSNAGVTVGTLRLNSDGGYVFTPAANYNGAVPVVTYQTNTGASSTLTLTVDTVDDATQTVVDTNSTNEDTTLTVAAGSGGVLDNDSDADDTLTVASFSVAGDDTSYTAGDTATMVGVGSLQLNSDGGYVFIPAENYNGTVPEVTYTTNTGASSTLSLTVTPVMDGPSVSATIESVTNTYQAPPSTGMQQTAYRTLEPTTDSTQFPGLRSGTPTDTDNPYAFYDGTSGPGTGLLDYLDVIATNGLIYLEAGSEVHFTGFFDDALLIELGGQRLFASTGDNWGHYDTSRSGTYRLGAADVTSSGVFTATQPGYYSLDIYPGNMSGLGQFSISVNIDGVQTPLNSANLPLYRNIQDVDAANKAHEEFQDVDVDGTDTTGGVYVVTDLDYVYQIRLDASFVDDNSHRNLVLSDITVDNLPAGATIGNASPVANGDGTYNSGTMIELTSDNELTVAQLNQITVSATSSTSLEESLTTTISIKQLIEGGDFDDGLDGGTDDERFIGHVGDDILTGGGGDDIFVWNKDDVGTVADVAHDEITDFDADNDVLDLSDLLGDSSHTIEGMDVEGNLQLNIKDGDDVVVQEIELTGVSTAGTTAADLLNNLLNTGAIDDGM